MSIETVEKKAIKFKKAPRYCNVFYNNEVTTVDTVEITICTVFNYSKQKAAQLTRQIHMEGKGIIHVNSKEVCELKKTMVENLLSELGDSALKHDVSQYEDD